METIRVRDFAELEQRIAALGRPELGHQRLFRGQTRVYRSAPEAPPAIVPALARGASQNYDGSWLVRLTQLLHEFKGTDPRAVPPEFAMFWAPALIQHYGPGSFYVDVTFDLSTALWFALHQWHQRWYQFSIGDDSTTYHRVQSIAWHTAYELDEKQEGPAVFVFDVPDWDGILVPGFGAVVNLLGGPMGDWLHENATRLRAQSGALLHANPKLMGKSDVASLLRAVVILDREFDRATVPGLARRTTELFPPPDKDLAYAVLLSLPGQIAFQPTRIEHPLDVSWYVDGAPDTWPKEFVQITGTGDRSSPATISVTNPPAPQTWHDAMRGFVQLFAQPTPLWLHPVLVSQSRQQTDDDAAIAIGSEVFRLRDALPILLDSLLFRSTPAAEPEEHSSWIESALPIGLPDVLESYAANNVCAELAPIDYMQTGGRYSPGVPRAIWVARAGLEFVVQVFQASKEGSQSYRARYRYDRVLGTFARVESGESQSAAVSAMLRKSLYAVLTLLRDLAPGLKPPPTYAFTLDRGENERRLPASMVIAQRARLEKVARGRAYVPRLLDGGRYSLGVRMDEEAIPSDPHEALAALSFLDQMRGQYVDVVRPIRDRLRDDAG